MFATLSFRLLLPSLLLAALALGVSSAIADRGVGIDRGVLEVATKLEPGKGYFLPEIGIINTGDEPTDYLMSVGYLAERPERRPDGSWFTFEPERFSLAPGQSRSVAVGVKVPSGANAGEYFALVRAQTVAPSEGGASVGIAAAAQVTFSVEPAGFVEAWMNRANRWLYDAAPWTYLLPAAALLGFLAYRARRLPFRLRIERK